MPNGTHRRRASSGFVGIALASALAAGCQQPAVQRVDPLPLAPIPAPTATAPAATATPAPPPAPVVAKAPESPPPPPTPLLDSLDRQAREVQKIALAALIEPEPRKAPEPKPQPPRPTPPKEKPKEAAPPKPVPPPRDVWGDGLKELRALAHERAASSADSGDLWAFRALLLDELARPAGNVPDPALWRTVLTPLVDNSGPATTDAPARAEVIQSAVAALEEREGPVIADLELCRKVSGFGAYEPLPPTARKAGRPLILYCEIAGLRYEPVGDMFRSRLATHLEVVSIEDGKSVWQQPLGTAEDVCRRRRRDYFVPYRITLPAALSPGAYDLRLTQTDLIADRSATRAIRLTIAP